ncbi:MAG: DegT/DnrJ/EryC1/StrS family aminotransferase [Candidatus Marsarchaeota archaeon]|nr:DegT/DnrJ/EryC1/StrS family aminotransferase [Candidatus Marsarchaeota archaeon]
MVPISAPVIGEREKEAAIAVLSSGQLAQGPVVQEFEARFAAMCGVRYAVATSSGTTALHLALLSHGIGVGDEVVTTPFSFVATGNAITYTGAKPVFVDIDSDTYNIDPDLIEEKISPKTRAILPVHLYGHPADMDRIMEIAARHDLVVVEDACQAHGASARGRKVGAFGTGAFSFYPTKNMTTLEGGMITTDDAEVAKTARMLREHGAEERYRHEKLGFNFRMTDLQAAIGLVQLDRLPEFNQKRIENARYLSEHLMNLGTLRTPVVRSDCVHVFHQYTIRVGSNRAALVDELRSRGVATAIYYPTPIHQQPLYRGLGHDEHLPVAEKAAQEVLSLPVHPALTPEDLEAIVREVSELC